jgi:hypothetical protein
MNPRHSIPEAVIWLFPTPKNRVAQKIVGCEVDWLALV